VNFIIGMSTIGRRAITHETTIIITTKAKRDLSSVMRAF
jgi:hypothetical protein